MRRLRYYSEVVTLQLIQEKCNNCGICTKVCPHGVFEIINKQVYIVGRDFCMECGACRKNCPQGAIMLDVGDGCGCAAGIIQSKLKRTRPTCGCSEQTSCN
jgi:NAD-dependent dihydropyrimidine dehydrogenase PreA subunit